MARIWPAARSRSKRVGPKQALLAPAQAETTDVILHVVAAAVEADAAVSTVGAVEVEGIGDKDCVQGALAIS